MAGVGLPHAAIAEQVQRGIDLVVHLERRPDGPAGRHRDRRGGAGGRSDRGPHDRARRRRERAPACCRPWPARRRGPAGAGGARRRCWPARRRRAGCALALEPLRRAGPRGLRALDRRAPPPRRAWRRGCGRAAAGASPARRWRLPLAVAGPAVAGWAISSRRRRYRAAARALAAGSRDRGRRLARRRPLAARFAAGRRRIARRSGRAELARLGAELDLGAGTVEAVAAWRRRMRSERVDAFAAALLSQRLAGGDLAGAAAALRRRRGGARPGRRGRALGHRAGTLHRPAGGGDAERRGGLRRAGPARFHRPRCSARRPAAVLLVLAAALQVAGFVAIRHFSRVAE